MYGQPQPAGNIPRPKVNSNLQSKEDRLGSKTAPIDSDFVRIH
jgi:hypothetical protein